MGNTAKNDARRLGRAQKAKRAAEMRLAGKSFQAIADELGYADRSGARKALDAYRAELPRAAVEELRDELLERSDANYATAFKALDVLVAKDGLCTDVIDAAAKVARILKVHGELGGVIKSAPPAVVTVTQNSTGWDLSKYTPEELVTLQALAKKQESTASNVVEKTDTEKKA